MTIITDQYVTPLRTYRLSREFVSIFIAIRGRSRLVRRKWDWHLLGALSRDPTVVWC